MFVKIVLMIMSLLRAQEHLAALHELLEKGRSVAIWSIGIFLRYSSSETFASSWRSPAEIGILSLRNERVVLTFHTVLKRQLRDLAHRAPGATRVQLGLMRLALKGRDPLRYSDKFGVFRLVVQGDLLRASIPAYATIKSPGATCGTGEQIIQARQVGGGFFFDIEPHRT